MKVRSFFQMKKFQLKIKTNQGDRVKSIHPSLMTLGSAQDNIIRVKGAKPHHCIIYTNLGQLIVKIMDADAVCWINSVPVNTEANFNLGDQLTLSGSSTPFILETETKKKKK